MQIILNTDEVNIIGKALATEGNAQQGETQEEVDYFFEISNLYNRLKSYMTIEPIEPKRPVTIYTKIDSTDKSEEETLQEWVQEIQGNLDGDYFIYKIKGTYVHTMFMYNVIGAVQMEKKTASWITKQLNNERIFL